MKTQMSLELLVIILISVLLLNTFLHFINVGLREGERELLRREVKLAIDKIQESINYVSSLGANGSKIIEIGFPCGLNFSAIQQNLVLAKSEFLQSVLFSNLTLRMKFSELEKGRHRLLFLNTGDSIEIDELYSQLILLPPTYFISRPKNSTSEFNVTLKNLLNSPVPDVRFSLVGEIASWVRIDEAQINLIECEMVADTCSKENELIFENVPSSYSTPKFGTFLEVNLKVCAIDTSDDNSQNYDTFYFLNLNSTDLRNSVSAKLTESFQINEHVMKVVSASNDTLVLVREGFTILPGEAEKVLKIKVRIPLSRAGIYGGNLLVIGGGNMSASKILVEVISLPISELSIILAEDPSFSQQNYRFQKGEELFYKIVATDSLGNPGEGRVEIRIMDSTSSILYSGWAELNEEGKIIGAFTIPTEARSGKWRFVVIMPERNIIQEREFEVHGNLTKIFIKTYADPLFQFEANSFARGGKIYYKVIAVDEDNYFTSSILNLSILNPSDSPVQSNLLEIFGKYGGEFNIPIDAQLGVWKINATDIRFGVSSSAAFSVLANIHLHNAFVITDKTYYKAGEICQILLSVEDQQFQAVPMLGNRIRVNIKRSEGAPEYSFTGSEMEYKCLGVLKCPLYKQCCYVYGLNTSFLLAGKVYFIDVEITDLIDVDIKIYESRSFKVTS
ncbi:MAG: hypothetical protein QW507_00880 [Candidatus Nanoarchaeia archaeon]|nr:hypothetical protein [Candidatus Haiyanarchaeum thermophilum]MCW1303370.1 hypothetical protein [Candidatus Haiyanarchaeum thermophilum]MCW1303943.1 hypothetical protein [Candidatus Haiyanarchaeum thermophilum]MCW1306732.1 hypothetical protein [Candidatus Haiyanarchaeum thermophilum]MCW1307569.1 hypothetical protein [Candidatus Haiyanarchaeum thermophilum]